MSVAAVADDANMSDMPTRHNAVSVRVLTTAHRNIGSLFAPARARRKLLQAGRAVLSPTWLPVCSSRKGTSNETTRSGSSQKHQ